MDMDFAQNTFARPENKKKKIFFTKKPSISEEDHEIVAELNMLNDEIKSLHTGLDNTTDPALIDAYIYEIKALNMRYKYYLGLCKQKGIAANVF